MSNKRSTLNKGAYLAAIGMFIGRNFAPNIQILMAVIFIIIIIVDLIKFPNKIKNKYLLRQNILSILLILSYMFALMSEYFHWNSSIQMALQIITIAFLVILMVSGAIKVFRSGDSQKIKDIKISLSIIGISIIIFLLTYIGYLVTK